MTECLLDTGVQVPYSSYDCYKEFKLKTRINDSVEARVISAYRTNLGPVGVVICSLILGTCKFKHKFILYKKTFTTCYSRIRLCSRF